WSASVVSSHRSVGLRDVHSLPTRRSSDLERLYRIILTPELQGGFTVTVPSLPGCITWGEDIEHAKAMAREAIGLYIEDMVAQGRSEEHTSELQSRENLVCRLLLEKKKGGG